MHILHLDAGREMRGGQWQVLRLLEGLAAAGVESTLLAPAESPLFEAARREGRRVDPLSVMRAAGQARLHDLVHAHDARTHTLAAIAGGAPLVVSRRVAFSIRKGFASQWKYRRAARYIAVSEYVRSVLLQAKIPEGKIGVVYDGVPVLEETGTLPRSARVVAPQSLGDPQKGARLAAAAAALAEVDLQFSTDLSRDLRHASLLLYVTHCEGLGSGVLLAMSAGVPVVASRVGGLPEIVRHGETGLLVENRPEAIAAAIRQVLRDRVAARAMGSAARQAVIERFTVDHMVRRTMEVYRQVLS